jgi:hypothetical protein
MLEYELLGLGMLGLEWIRSLFSRITGTLRDVNLVLD